MSPRPRLIHIHIHIHILIHIHMVLTHHVTAIAAVPRHPITSAHPLLIITLTHVSTK